MFDVLSGEFTLTLQSSPPFVVESAFALALAVLLAAPLIANVHFLLVRILDECFEYRRCAKADTVNVSTVTDSYGIFTRASRCVLFR